MINEELMLRYGAEKIQLKKGEMLFEKNDVPRFFYQVIEGDVKSMISTKRVGSLYKKLFLEVEALVTLPDR